MSQSDSKVKIEIKHELVWIFVFSVLLIGVINFWPLATALRVILGFPFLLLFPGYVLLVALFPEKENLDNSDRMILSFCISITLVTLLGFLLNYTPWGINLGSTLTVVSIFIVVFSGVALYKRYNLPYEKRYLLSTAVDKSRWQNSSWIDISLSVVLGITILSVVLIFICVVSISTSGERFTEFYRQNEDGEITDIDEVFVYGEGNSISLGITNKEGRKSVYRVIAFLEGEPVGGIGFIELPNGESWEENLIISPQTIGEQQMLEIILDREGSDFPYRTLRLWVDVIPQE